MDPDRSSVADQNGKGYRQVLNMMPLGLGNILVLPNERKSESADAKEELAHV